MEKRMKVDASLLLYMAIGILGGACVGIEGSLNSILGKHVGVLRATIAPCAVGLVTILIVVAAVYQGQWGTAQEWLSAPWYTYLGGVAAIVFVGSIIYVSPKVGMAAAFSAVLVGQFAASLLVDATGFVTGERLPVTLWRIVGLGFVIVGMRLFFIRPT
jgi:bacterial/archaeal transporter family-2 protein